MSSHRQVIYRVSMPSPETHYYHVTMELPSSGLEEVVLSLPTWTPGSYLIREYARHLVQLRAWDAHKTPLSITPKNKAQWIIHLGKTTTRLTVEYEVYAYELSVRTSYLDRQYGIITGTSLFLYADNGKTWPVEVIIDPPPGWDVATSLETIGPEKHHYQADSYDTLVDSPIQLGSLTQTSFLVDNVEHILVMGGFGTIPNPPVQLIDHLRQIIACTEAIFGSLPYPHYRFFVTISDKGGGGLEHRNGANIMVSRDLFENPRHYQRLLSLFAHEYFHLWNVKRLRPEQLGPFNYQEEVYTSLLWAMEGLTDYFAQWLLAKSGAIPARDVLEQWAKNLYQLSQMPGREWTSLASASLEAWIRLYRPDANTPNITISYYLKGALLGIFLDLQLRAQREEHSGLDSIWRKLWDTYGDAGFPEEAIESVIKEIGGEPLSDALDRYVHGTAWFDEDLLATVGLAIEKTFQHPDEPHPVWIGIETIERAGKLYAATVYRESPGERAGISPDDEILAVSQVRVSSRDEWTKALQIHSTERALTMDIAHHGAIERISVRPEESRPDQWKFVPIAQRTRDQEQAFQAWLGQPYPFGES